ncbi:hypothetical protein GCM10022403_030750 [Streptomyces coacervatus]|uniref:Uncharacterized protein n=1 Tax=Streptomyces coacervatus TaxID=647381 RepID=A0ABP7HJS8_9ACTN|nr:DUF5819 family protein [Streptomyces coacervatus]MDF2271430.1 DUF5819 family protein [Streptomyces coacervatus]
MDAYGTDSDARHGPDGPGRPGDAPEPDGPPEPDRSPVPDSPAELGGADRTADPRDVPPDAAAFDPGAAASVVAPAPGPYAEPRTGVAALSLRYQIGAALALAVVAVVVCVHVGMVFLHVAPSNTLTKAHGKAIDDWIYPEFEQNWKLFAPNPLQQNIAVQVRAEVQAKNGEVRTTGWYDLSAQDGRAIDGNLLPSHTEQNELRRAWDFFVATHDTNNRPSGLRGALSETYLRRIVVLRLDRDDAAGKGGVVEQVQVRSRTTNVPPPKWSAEKISDKPMDRVLPWWPVTAADTDGDAQ